MLPPRADPQLDAPRRYRLGFQQSTRPFQRARRTRPEQAERRAGHSGHRRTCDDDRLGRSRPVTARPNQRGRKNNTGRAAALGPDPRSGPVLSTLMACVQEAAYERPLKFYEWAEAALDKANP